MTQMQMAMFMKKRLDARRRTVDFAAWSRTVQSRRPAPRLRGSFQLENSNFNIGK
jgi:hypothetical protein